MSILHQQTQSNTPPPPLPLQSPGHLLRGPGDSGVNGRCQAFGDQRWFTILYGFFLTFPPKFRTIKIS